MSLLKFVKSLPADFVCAPIYKKGSKLISGTLSEGKTPSSWGQEVSDFREKAVASSPVQDEEDTLSYFSRLAEED